MGSPFSRLARWNRCRLDSAARAAVRICLAACPPDFRRRFAPALVDTFQDQLDRAFSEKGWAGWLSCVAGECGNLLVQALRLYRRRRAADSALNGSEHSLPDPLRAGEGPPVWNPTTELRGAFRKLVRSPVFSLGVVVLLAVGIGLNTTAFSILNAYLLRPLPFPDSDRLVSVRSLPPGAPATLASSVPRGLPELKWEIPPELAEETISWDLDAFTLVGDGRPKVLLGAWVTPGYLRALGTRAQIGRLLEEKDGEPGAPPVAVIGHQLWQQRYGGSPTVIGQTISAFTSDRPDDAESFTIVGVLPAGFWFINRYTGILTNLTSERMPYLMKLRAGVSAAEVARYLNSLVQSQLGNIDPAWPGMIVTSVQEVYVRSVRPSLIVLFIATALVLVIACGNVAMLLTVRALGRHQELAIRRALGASRLRIGTELCFEGLTLALVAGLFGLGLAFFTLQTLGPAIETQLRTSVPGGIEALRIGLIGILVSLSLSGLTALLFAVIPAFVVTHRSLARSLMTQSRSASDTPGQQSFRNLVVASEIAVSLMLLITASLMMQSSHFLHRLDLGFDPQNVMTAGLSLRQQNYPEDHLLTDFSSRLLASIRQVPGVASAALMSGSPLQERRSAEVRKEGTVEEQLPAAVTYLVSEDYFRTLNIPLFSGREFDARDQSQSQPVAVLSRSLARALWPDQPALGRRVRLGQEGENAPWRSVVGVSQDVLETLTADPLPDIYIPYSQSPTRFMTVLARVESENAVPFSGLDKIVQKLDPMAAVMDPGMLEGYLSQQRQGPSFLATMLSTFTGFATILALLGLSATVSYAAGQRRRDIAIRMALGASRRSVVRLFLRQALRVVSAGALLGLLGGLWLSQSLSSQLHGVKSSDLPTMVWATLALCLAAMASVWLPARRASATDPALILRK